MELFDKAAEQDTANSGSIHAPDGVSTQAEGLKYVKGDDATAQASLDAFQQSLDGPTPNARPEQDV